MIPAFLIVIISHKYKEAFLFYELHLFVNICFIIARLSILGVNDDSAN